MEFRTFVVGDLETNCYLLWSGTAAGVIDPGGPMDELIEFVTDQRLEPKWIVNTHGHGDHIAGNAELMERFGIPLLIHPTDRALLTSAAANLSGSYGMSLTSPDASGTLVEGQRLELGLERLTVIATPGHSPGGISLYTPGLLFSGDTLFCEAIGRTDLPGGDYAELISSIAQRLFQLPPETEILPGHGPATTIGHEIMHNPFLRLPLP